jgi:hypothetical protein
MTNDDASIEIEIHRPANVLYLDLNGRPGVDALRRAAEETVAAAESLRDGFDVISDLSGFEPSTPEAAEQIERARDEIANRDLGRVIRVDDDAERTAGEAIAVGRGGGCRERRTAP